MAVSSSGPVRTNLKLDPELRDRLRRLAEARRRTPHWLMREAIVQYLAREEALERVRADALAAWNEYEATGTGIGTFTPTMPACTSNSNCRAAPPSRVKMAVPFPHGLTLTRFTASS